MNERSEINRALAKALAYADCGKYDEAQRWGEVLLRKLELAGVFKAGGVEVKDAKTLWVPELTQAQRARLQRKVGEVFGKPLQGGCILSDFTCLFVLWGLTAVGLLCSKRVWPDGREEWLLVSIARYIRSRRNL